MRENWNQSLETEIPEPFQAVEMMRSNGREEDLEKRRMLCSLELWLLQFINKESESTNNSGGEEL